MAVVKINYAKCKPETCPGGKCAATKDCKSKALRQIEAGEKPVVDPSICHGCLKCQVDCPLGAVEETTR